MRFSLWLSLLYITKMFNLDDIKNENNKEHNKKWPFIPDYPYRTLIIGGSGSRKTNALLNLMKEPDDIDKIYLYTKDLSEPKYEFLIKKCEDTGIRHFNDLNDLNQTLQMTFMKILMTTTQTEKEKF